MKIPTLHHGATYKVRVPHLGSMEAVWNSRTQQFRAGGAYVTLYLLVTTPGSSINHIETPTIKHMSATMGRRFTGKVLLEIDCDRLRDHPGEAARWVEWFRTSFLTRIPPR